MVKARNTTIAWIIGIIIILLIGGGIILGIILIPPTTQSAFAVHSETNSVMSCDVDNNLCSFSLSDSHRASIFEFILDNGVSIIISESKCVQIEGIWKNNRCFIYNLLNKQIGKAVYSSQSSYTIDGRTEKAVINSFSEERIIVGDSCPSCGGEFRSISVSWSMPLVSETSTTGCTSDSDCLSTEECKNEVCVLKEEPTIPNYIPYIAIAVIVIFIIIAIVLIAMKRK